MHSKTPAREVGITPGVETTTGPLGQGIIHHAVGMALAELLASEFNRDGHVIVDHRTYAFLGDGCLMEASATRRSLAGAWKLNKLIALYDDNGISIDGQVAPWFIDNTRSASPPAAGTSSARSTATMTASTRSTPPSRGQTKRRQTDADRLQDPIGKGSPNRANTSKAHGEPLGAAEIALTREAIGWSAAVHHSADVAAAWDCRDAGAAAGRVGTATRCTPRLPRAGGRVRAPHGWRPAGQLRRHLGRGESPPRTKAETVASRKASQIALEFFTAKLPELLGGSADLTGSNLTNTSRRPTCASTTTPRS